MGDLFHDDPDNLLALSFISADWAEKRARTAVDRALEEIGNAHSLDPKVASKRQTRAQRVGRAFRDDSLICLAFAEFFMGAKAEAQSVSLRAATDEIQALMRGVSDLQKRLTSLGATLQVSSHNQAGEEIMGAAISAAWNLDDATKALARAQGELEAAMPFAPVNAKGAGGAMGKLRLPPDVVLFRKLETIWQAAGLDTGGGEAGDGMYVFMHHAFEVADPDRVRGGWEDALRKKVKREIGKHKEEASEK